METEQDVLRWAGAGAALGLLTGLVFTFWQVFFVGGLRLESFAFADPISWVAAGMIIGGVAGCALLAAIIPIARNWFVQDQCGTRRQHS